MIVIPNAEQELPMKRWSLKEYLFFAVFASVLISAQAWGSGGKLPDFTGLVEQTRPAVVNISSTQKIQRERRGFPHGQIPENTRHGRVL